MHTKCIAYTVPSYEFDRVRKGVPIEELHKLSEPKEFIPEELTPKGFGNYARRKARKDACNQGVGHEN